ncbi:MULTISPECIES: pantoate--beta-alanine ligase [Micrococcales]|uniref:pantoate--beta-alanine ligase n=1 Tax=Micrococcales TaxID=85006 RepID=UPI0004A9E829|nr:MULTISPECIES: pantoate--beta-alanine ligase [Micrococcales]
MTGELFVARTLEEFFAQISQRMGEAEARIHAEESERIAHEGVDPEGEPGKPRVATMGLVPTMGALHDGHATLIRRAREQNDVVAVSLFVNPLQFGPDEDYDKYPRTEEKDLQLLREYGVDIAFAPSLEAMYPGGEPLVRVSSGELGTMFEGAARPGHFDGVLTVVNKLFNVVVSAAGTHRARAYFGQKDAQQVALVQRMVADFNIPITVCPVAIVRDDDGLALSSRNAYLSPEERRAALVLSRTLALLREEGLSRGYAGIDVDAARERISERDGVELEYLEIVDPLTFAAPTEGSERATALAAIRVGGTRLLDNMDVI